LYGYINEFKRGYHPGAELGNYNVIAPSTNASGRYLLRVVW